MKFKIANVHKINCKKQQPQVFYKKAIVKSLSILTGKHLCWSLFLLKSLAFSSAYRKSGTWDPGPRTHSQDSGTRTFTWGTGPGILHVGPFTWDLGPYVWKPGPKTFTWNAGPISTIIVIIFSDSMMF